MLWHAVMREDKVLVLCSGVVTSTVPYLYMQFILDKCSYGGVCSFFLDICYGP